MLHLVLLCGKKSSKVSLLLYKAHVLFLDLLPEQPDKLCKTKPATSHLLLMGLSTVADVCCTYEVQDFSPSPDRVVSMCRSVLPALAFSPVQRRHSVTSRKISHPVSFGTCIARTGWLRHCLAQLLNTNSRSRLL